MNDASPTAVAAADQAGDGSRPWPLIVFLIGSAIALLLALWPPYLPMVDAPNHLARLHILSAAPDAPIRAPYEVVWNLIPNLGLDLFHLALRGVATPEATIRLAVVGSIAAMLGAVLAIQWQWLGRVSWSLAIAPALVFSLPWYMGYINYMMGMAATLVAVALYLRGGGRMGPGRLVLFAAFGIVILLCHVAAFGAYAVLLGGLHALGSGFPRRWPDWRRAMGRGFIVAIALFPAALFFVLAEKPPSTIGIVYEAMKIRLPLAPFISSGNVVDLAAMGLIIVPLAFMRRWLSFSLMPEARAPLIVFAIVMMLLPNRVDTAVDVDSRLFPLLLLCMLAAMRTELRPGGPPPLPALLALLVVLGLRFGPVLAHEIDYNRQVAELRRSLAVIAPGSRVLGATDPETGPDCRPMSRPRLPDWTFHFASFATIDRAALTPLIFAGRGMQPIRLRPEVEEIASPVAGTPAPIPIMRAADNPALRDRLDQVLAAQRISNYFVGWRTRFDYMLLLHEGCVVNPYPDELTELARGSFFTIYRIVRPG